MGREVGRKEEKTNERGKTMEGIKKRWWKDNSWRREREREEVM